MPAFGGGGVPVGDIATMSDLVRQAAVAAGGRTALDAVAGRPRHSTGQRGALTWAELDERVDATAAGLRAIGVAAGPAAVLQLDAGIDLTVAFLAAGRAGIVAVPVQQDLPVEQLAAVVTDTGAATLLTANVLGVAAAADLGIRHLVVAGPTPADHGHTLADVQRARARAGSGSSGGGHDPRASAAAVVFYTGKARGRPRGAVHTHAALLAAVEQAAGASLVGSGDVVLAAVPGFHPLGLVGAVGLAARAGATVLLAAPEDAADAPGMLTERGVTVVIAVPPVLASWSRRSDADLASSFATVRHAVSGGAPLDARRAARITAVTTVPVHNGYGLAEGGPMLTSTALSSEPGAAASLGYPLPGVDLELRDDGGGRVDDGDPGEVFIRAGSLFAGYAPGAAGGPRRDGWFGTGDLGYLDEAGRLRLVGRLQDRAVVRGFPVYPAEIEAVLTSHQAVAEASVVRVGEPPQLHAYAVLADRATADVDDLVRWCARSLAPFKRPAVVSIVERLPHTPTGKIRPGA